MYICITHVFLNMQYRCKIYTCILHKELYICNTYVGYTPILHVSNICITGVLPMYYRCMNNMCYTPNNTTSVVHVYHTCNTRVARLVLKECASPILINNQPYRNTHDMIDIHWIILINENIHQNNMTAYDVQILESW